MTATQLGRPPKGGKRAVVQVKVPEPIRKGLADWSAEHGDLPLTDMGAYYLISGWNAARKEQGLEPIPMPDYLIDAVESAGVPEVQEALLAG